MLMCLLLGAAAAQPPGAPGPPGPAPGTGKTGGTTSTPNHPASGVSLPHAVGTLGYYSPTRCTVQREMGQGGPTANMDFRMDAQTVQSPGLKSRDRVVVVFEMAKGEGYRAIAVLLCPQGTDPQSLLKSLPKPK